MQIGGPRRISICQRPSWGTGRSIPELRQSRLVSDLPRLRFAYHSDPNGNPADSSFRETAPWPTYGAERNIMLLRGDGLSVIRDDYRQEAISFINSRSAEFGY